VAGLGGHGHASATGAEMTAPPAMQLEAWLHERLGLPLPLGTVRAAYQLCGPVSREFLTRAAGALLAGCEALRTELAWSDSGQPLTVLAPTVSVPVAWTDVRGLAPAEREAALAGCAAQAAAGLDPGAPGLRVHAAQTGEADVIVWLSTRRWQVGAASAGMLGRALLDAYAVVAGGAAAGTPGGPAPAADIAVVADPDAISGRERRTLSLEGPPGEALRALIGRTGCSPEEALYAGLAVVLPQYAAPSRVTLARPAPSAGIGPEAGLWTVPLDITGNPSVSELLAQARRAIDAAPGRGLTLLGAHAGAVPRRPDDAFADPVAEAAVAVGTRPAPAHRPGLELRHLAATAWHPEVALHVTVSPAAPEQLVIEHRTDRYPHARILQIRDHLGVVWAAAAADPAAHVRNVPLLTPAERELVLHTWQGAALPYPRVPVDQRVSQIAADHPEVAAGEFRGIRLTYAELERRGNQLADHLIRLGAGRESIVAISMERCLEVLVAIIGTFKAGAGFVFVDPDAPEARFRFMLADTQALAVLTTSAVAGRLPAGCPAISVDELAGGSDVAPPAVTDDGCLAYVLYTSGSTGIPKGVMVEHGEVANFIRWLGGKQFGLRPGDRILAHMALIFDFAEGEILTALAYGATLVMVGDAERTNPDVLGEMLTAERIAFLNGPPALLSRIPVAAYPDLRCLVAGGEAFTRELVERWAAPGRQFVNGYGPTEAAVGCVSFECLPAAAWPVVSSPPIGRAMPNRSAYILDDDGGLVAPGVPGEIVVGGDGLARGYLGSPSLTAQRFVPDPIRRGRRMYRTGDLGYWTAEGLIQYLGRADSQVKVNGLRIELGEIDAALLRHPRVLDAATVVVRLGDSAARLAACVCYAAEQPSPAELRDHLAGILPAYMIPGEFVTVPEIPLTGAGKTDHKALDGLVSNSRGTSDFVLPRTEAERQADAVVQAVLGRPVGMLDDIYLGVDRAAAAVLIADRLSVRWRMTLAPAAVYRLQTVRELCQLMPTAGTLATVNLGAVTEPDETLLASIESMSDGEIAAMSRRLELDDWLG
jgi:amino acid adenylation domain-containing protein